MNDGSPNEEDDKIDNDGTRNKEGANDGTPNEEDDKIETDGLETKNA